MASDMKAPGTHAFAALVAASKTYLDPRLVAWLEPHVARAGVVSREAALAAGAVADLTSRGGKRLRAALVALGFAMAEGEPALRRDLASVFAIVGPAMIAMELLQTYLLIHDDWMDNDAVRRGGPAVHIVLREQLGSQPSGDAAAVLAGDLASAFAQAALLECPVEPARILAAARAFTLIQEEVVTGQLSEMFRGPFEAGPGVETVHALKTASYTVTGPLRLGASLAGAGPSLARWIPRFGERVGVAFQLRDDILGVFGDPEATGKPVWNDIRQGKRTALVAQVATSSEGVAMLRHVLGKADASEEDIKKLVDYMEASGAKARVESRIAGLLAEARRDLAEATFLGAATVELLEGATLALGERGS